MQAWTTLSNLPPFDTNHPTLGQSISDSILRWSTDLLVTLRIPLLQIRPPRPREPSFHPPRQTISWSDSEPCSTNSMPRHCKPHCKHRKHSLTKSMPPLSRWPLTSRGSSMPCTPLRVDDPLPRLLTERPYSPPCRDRLHCLQKPQRTPQSILITPLILHLGHPHCC